MDFSNRVQHQSAAGAVSGGAAVGTPKKGSGNFSSKGWRITFASLLIAIAALILALALLFVFNNSGENSYLNKSDFQAVDINVAGNSSDQIYFGNIKAINDQYVVLRNIYYIPQSSSSSSITLQPLVCLIDKPENQMVISRTSINWWENLQPSGKVAQAISNYQKNPTGCASTSSTTSSTSSNNSSASSSSSNSSTTGTTGTTGTSNNSSSSSTTTGKK